MSHTDLEPREPIAPAVPVAPAGVIGDRPIPGGPQPRGFLAAFVLAWFGISIALSTILGASIPKVFAFLDDETKGLNLSIVAAIGGIVVIVVTPLFGRMSDRTMSRLGQRRPWILGGSLAGMAGVVVLAVAADLWQVALGWAIAQAAASAANAIAIIGGAVIVAALPNDAQWSWFVVPGVLGTAFSAVLFFRLHDIVRTERPAPWRWADVLSTYWLDPIRYRDLFWAWMCRLLVTMSIATVVLYLLFFIIDRLEVPAEEASGSLATVIVAYTLTSIATTVLFGWISDRTGRRKPIVLISALLSAGGLGVAAVAPDLGVFLVAMALVGAAQGAFVSVDVAMMTEVLPSFDEAGKDLGIVALSYQVPQVLVPVIAIPLLAIGGGENYTALFVAAIAFGVLGGLAVLPIKGVR